MAVVLQGVLSAFSQLGLILGPPVGGALYSAGGFHLPFWVSGGAYMGVGLLSIWLLPNPMDGKEIKPILNNREKHT